MNKETMGLYVVRDKVAEGNSPVFEQVNNAAAARVFRLKALKEAGDSMEDFELYLIGHRNGMELKGCVPELIDSGEKYAASGN